MNLRREAAWWTAGLGYAVGLLQGRYAPGIAVWTVLVYVAVGAWRCRERRFVTPPKL